ncbi:hypothetical protein GCM10011332_31690 [Terasakiella brassicae]|uniref:Uncharacterized protein n=1 Tax=Terasakiella brassicae TaxID=1634917 RepID=A0A917C757_9PROT|nr:hypothetical protein [Terasakiella brassicae]GGF75372.1 hypothetical protein GCM10011332_31690 [Terasakiella brassicae]
MRLSQFDLTEEPSQAPQRLYQWAITVTAKVAGRLSPKDVDDIRVYFPLLNCTVANVRSVQMRGTGDCGQVIAFTVDLALFAENERMSLVQIDGATCIDVVGYDTTLNLIDPQIRVSPQQTNLLNSSS